MDGNGTIADITSALDVDLGAAEQTCTSAATADNNVLDADCDYDGDTLTLTLREATTGELVTEGDTPGLQWPASIIDTKNVRDEELENVDLGSAAVTIDFE